MQDQTNLDQIIIEEITCNAFIGIYDREKQTKQSITISAYINYDLKKAGQSDQFTDTLCYSTLYKQIIECVNQKHYHLVEHLAETVCQTLLLAFPITQITLKILKTTAIKNCGGVGVEITRRNTYHHSNVPL